MQMKCLAPASLLSPWGSEGWLACVVNPASSGRRWGGSLARKDPDGQNETVRSLRRGNASDRTGHKEPHLCYDLVTFSVESRFLFFFFFFCRELSTSMSLVLPMPTEPHPSFGPRSPTLHPTFQRGWPSNSARHTPDSQFFQRGCRF